MATLSRTINCPKNSTPAIISTTTPVNFNDSTMFSYKIFNVNSLYTKNPRIIAYTVLTTAASVDVKKPEKITIIKIKGVNNTQNNCINRIHTDYKLNRSITKKFQYTAIQNKKINNIHI